MKGDFSRLRFDSEKHFSRVLQQQGRVTLDADSNEATDIVLHHMRTLTRDLFGPFGGPADAGFALALDQTGSPPVLWLGPGHYYVDGILCEIEAWVNYAHQPDYSPAATEADGTGNDALLAWLADPDDAPGFWIYLDVWERLITWIEDDSIRESALGGPDTCARTKVVWQVRALPWSSDWGDISSDAACATPLEHVTPTSTARMMARVDPGARTSDPCVIEPAAMYRGAQNQLYRVEIHQGGAAGVATFKWSRDNGSVATRWLGMDGDAIAVTNSRGFSVGDWVELSHEALVLDNQPGQLLRVANIEGDRLSIDPASIPASGAMPWTDQLVTPSARRWDQRANDDVLLHDGAVPVTESSGPGATWVDLEDSVQIAFAAGGTYRSGDYWVIPARVATGDIRWPQDGGQPALRAPQGIIHHLAPLGVLVNDDGLNMQQCRRCVAAATVECSVPTLTLPVEDGAELGSRHATPQRARTRVTGGKEGRKTSRRRKKKT